jgi:hypothetical protein
MVILREKPEVEIRRRFRLTPAAALPIKRASFYDAGVDMKPAAAIPWRLMST